MSFTNTFRRAAHGLRPSITLSAVLLLLPAGCGEDDRLPRFPASGQVLVDGQPAAGVQVRLHPMDRPDDLDALRPFGVTGADGGFQLGTYEEGDGAPTGSYKATLFWPDRPPDAGAPNDRLGGRNDDAASSAFEVTIAEGENTLEPFRAEAPPPSNRPSPPQPTGLNLDGFEAAPPS